MTIIEEVSIQRAILLPDDAGSNLRITLTTQVTLVQEANACVPSRAHNVRRESFDKQDADRLSEAVIGMAAYAKASVTKIMN